MSREGITKKEESGSCRNLAKNMSGRGSSKDAEEETGLESVSTSRGQSGCRKSQRETGVRALRGPLDRYKDVGFTLS